MPLSIPMACRSHTTKPGTNNLRVEGSDKEREPKELPKYAGKGIDGDFIECVKTRGTPFRNLQHAVNTMVIPHIAEIAYTLNRSLKWDSANQQFVGDHEANRFLDTARREPWQL